MRNIINKLKKVKKVYLVLSVILFVIVLNILISVTTGNNILKSATTSVLRTFGFNTEEIKNVNLTSDGYKDNEPGSFSVTKNADWIGENKAQITFDINTIEKNLDKYKDIIFVVDVSGSMNGDKLDKVKSDAKELTKTVLDNSNNNMALITFDTTSTIISELTNDKEAMLDYIDNLTTNGTTNYYSALSNVEKVLENYKKEKNRELTVLFLTDGYPNEQTNNETAQYQLLKEKYPYIKINAIQYEMGLDIKEEVKVISDNQYISNMTTLNNILFEASLNPEFYESFELVDYIDNKYFYVESENAITVPFGTVALTKEDGKQKVTWKVSDGIFRTGRKAQITIDVKVQEDKEEEDGYFSTNEKAEVTAKLKGTTTSSETLNDTPVLKAEYKVIYDANAPKGCSVDSPNSITKKAYQSVSIIDEQLECDGYSFKGWEVKNKDIKYVNDSTFTMPSSDVEIIGKWSKLSLKKSMEGKIQEQPILYKIVAEQAVMDNVASEYVTASTGVDFSQISSDTNGKGVYTFASTKNDKYPVHYYRGDIDNNNVKFAGLCWKIVRTTETGGTKLIYNGTPNSEGICDGASLGNNIEWIQYNPNFESLLGYSGYMYGTDETINNKKRSMTAWYSLLGKEEVRLGNLASTSYYYSKDVTYSNGLYTLSNASKKTWSSNYSNMKGYYTCASSTNTSCSNVYYVNTPYSWGMYYVEMSNGETYNNLLTKLSFVYGNDVEYNNGVYTLKNTITSNTTKWAEEYSTIAGENGYHYTCFSTSDTCETVSYIYVVNDSSSTYIDLTDGKMLQDIIDDAQVNTNSSIVKNKVDQWYENNLLKYVNNIEDTIWCNDRTYPTESSWNKDGSSLGSANEDKFLYNVPIRLRNGEIKLSCSNKNDRFTVSEENGNGDLTYPAALLTADEIMLAGAVFDHNNANQTFYLFDNYSDFWTMSPYGTSVNHFAITTRLFRSWLYGHPNSSSATLRPAISLKHDTVVYEGDGSESNPYIILTGVNTITIEGNGNIYASKPEAEEGTVITLTSRTAGDKILSFKMNGTLIDGTTFTMPNDNVVITDIEVFNGNEGELKTATVKNKISSVDINDCKVLNTSGTTLSAGCYYLDSDYYYDKQITSNLTTGEEIYIDLNGHSITYGGWANWDPVNYQGTTNAAFYGTNGNIYIYDSTKKNTVSLDFTLVEGYDEVTIQNIDYQASVWRASLKSDGNINVIDSNIVDKNMSGVESLDAKDLIISNSTLNINRAMTDGNTYITSSTVDFNSKDASAIFYTGNSSLTVKNSNITGKGPNFYVSGYPRTSDFDYNKAYGNISITASTIELSESAVASSDSASFGGNNLATMEIISSVLKISAIDRANTMLIDNSEITSFSEKMAPLHGMKNITIINNSKISAKAPSVINDNSHAPSASLVIENSELEALKGQDYAADKDTAMIAIFPSSSTSPVLKAKNSTFTSKGGIFNSNSGKIDIDNCTINTNTKNGAIEAGKCTNWSYSNGASYCTSTSYDSGDVFIRNSTITGEEFKTTNNKFIAGNNVTIENSTISGGKLYSKTSLNISKNSKLTLENYNTSDLYSDGSISIEDSTINVKTNNDGNIIYNYSGPLKVSNSNIISDNITSELAVGFGIRSYGGIEFDKVKYKGADIASTKAFSIKDSDLDIYTKSNIAFQFNTKEKSLIQNSNIKFNSSNKNAYLYYVLSGNIVEIDNTTIETDTNVAIAEPVYLKGNVSLKSAGDYQVYLRSTTGYLKVANNFKASTPIEVFNETLESSPSTEFLQLDTGVTDENLSTISSSIKSPYHDNWVLRANTDKTYMYWDTTNTVNTASFIDNDHVVSTASYYSDEAVEATTLDSYTNGNINYSFVGWNTKEDGSGTYLKSGVTKLKNNTKYYAVWEKDNIMVPNIVEKNMPRILQGIITFDIFKNLKYVVILLVIGLINFFVLVRAKKIK